MLNICHFVSGDLWAGAEVMVCHLLKGLQNYENLGLSVILLNEGKLAEEIRKLDIRNYVLNESERSFYETLVLIRQILNKNPPDAVHSHGYKQNILAFLTTRFFRGIKLIGTQHGMIEVFARKASLKQQLISRLNFFLLANWFHRVVGVSRDIREALIDQFGFKSDKVSVIHNGIEIRQNRLGQHNEETFVIGSCGRLFRVKDYPFMIEIARAMREKTNSIRFQLAGDGPELPKLQALIQKYGLEDSFELEGHLEDISGFYGGLDLFLNTSFHEGIPMSVLEAMAHCLPVIAPKVGGLSEIIEDGVEGYLLEHRKPEAFADKCFLLWKDKSLRQRMSRAAGEKASENFSVEQMAKQYYQLYVDAINNKSSF